jgi:mannose-6-phosphate isomerase-like protein (cupin superfamily)
MTRGSVVMAADIPAVSTQTGARVKVLLDTGTAGPGLIRRMVAVPQGSSFTGTAGGAGELWFVIEGAAGLSLAGERGAGLGPDRGMWLPPGTAYQVDAGGAGELLLDIVTLPAAAADASATAAADVSPAAADPQAGTAHSRDLPDCEIETTGDRKFRVLFGPGRGCSIATQFVGEIPPGRAPDHSHPYDEVVLILQGQGLAHIGGTIRELAPGSCLHLPPGLEHCLENTGTETLRVLGVFHPADSPAAKLDPRGSEDSGYPGAGIRTRLSTVIEFWLGPPRAAGTRRG